MRLVIPALLAAIAISPSVGAVDARDRSPFDKNPNCMDRNVDASKGDCIIKDTGTPRHRYPPPAKVVTPVPVTPPAAAAPVPREAAPPPGRKGG